LSHLRCGCHFLVPVLWIHDILLRIRICGSVLLTFGFWFGSGSCFFYSGWQDANPKKVLYFKVFWLLLFKGTFTSVFKAKKAKRSHKIMVPKSRFSSCFACWWKNPDPYTILTDPDLEGLKAYMDPKNPDPDPQHCFWPYGP
jgi:hypothetical protein